MLLILHCFPSTTSLFYDDLANQIINSPYNRVFDPEKCSLSPKNDQIWKVS